MLSTKSSSRKFRSWKPAPEEPYSSTRIIPEKQDTWVRYFDGGKEIHGQKESAKNENQTLNVCILYHVTRKQHMKGSYTGGETSTSHVEIAWFLATEKQVVGSMHLSEQVFWLPQAAHSKEVHKQIILCAQITE